MATTPTIPTETTVTKDITWIKTHIILSLFAVSLIAGSMFAGVSLFEGLLERHDSRIAAVAQAQASTSASTQAALVAQLTQDRATDAARDAAQTTLIQSLISKMNSERTATAKQVTTDSTLDAQAAAARLAAQTNAASTDVTATNDSVTMSLPLTRIVVADLDRLPQAQSDVNNLQSQLGAQEILTSDAKSELSQANQIITADKTELVATIKSDTATCDVRVDAQAAKDRKRGIWATLGGVIGGFLLRGAL